MWIGIIMSSTPLNSVKMVVGNLQKKGNSILNSQYKEIFVQKIHQLCLHTTLLIRSFVVIF